jgi:hypothetical protein
MPDTFNFLQNKYTKWYFNIIAAAKLRKLSNGYFEKHHIIPKSLGGSNRKDNLVKLTAREHFICHRLLVKMVEGTARHKMSSAVHRMIVQHGNNQQRVVPVGRVYENIRSQWAAEHSKWLTGKFSGSNNPNFGNKMSNEHKERIRQINLGKKLGPRSEEVKDKIRKASAGIPKNTGDAIKKSWELTKEDRVGKNHPMYGKSHSDETKIKMKESSSKRWTPEARAEASAKKKESNRIKKLKENNLAKIEFIPSRKG